MYIFLYKIHPVIKNPTLAAKAEALLPSNEQYMSAKM
jgi:hypothetical protein